MALPEPVRHGPVARVNRAGLPEACWLESNAAIGINNRSGLLRGARHPASLSPLALAGILNILMVSQAAGNKPCPGSGCGSAQEFGAVPAIADGNETDEINAFPQNARYGQPQDRLL